MVGVTWNHLKRYILEAHEVMNGAKALEKTSVFVPLLDT